MRGDHLCQCRNEYRPKEWCPYCNRTGTRHSLFADHSCTANRLAEVVYRDDDHQYENEEFDRTQDHGR